MPESNKEGPRVPEKSILPISKEAVDKSLAEIANNPHKTLAGEIAVIKTQNPFLFTYMDFLANMPGKSYFDYMEGACWTHKILRTQAEMNNQQLPQISSNLLTAFFEDQKQALSEVQGGQKEFVLFADEARKAATEDPEFVRALSEFAKYRTSATDFYAGVINTYVPIRNALQSKDLEEKLNGQAPEPEGRIKDDRNTPVITMDKLLEKVTAERKPLSEEELKETQKIAREIWTKAMEKFGDKDYIKIADKRQALTQHLTLYRGKEIKEGMGERLPPMTDLIIMTNDDESRIVHKYYFVPDGVIKTTFDFTETKDIHLGNGAINVEVGNEGKLQNPQVKFDMTEPDELRKQAKRQIEGRTEETYRPDKADLSNLLSSLSSAIPSGY